jgi:hypothetical protein
MINKIYNSKAIARNIETVLKTGDSSKLNKPTYDWLYLLSGFIAHYDLAGFLSYYQDVELLVNDLRGALPIERDLCIRDLNDTGHDNPDRDYNGYGKQYCQSKLDTTEAVKVVVDKWGGTATQLATEDKLKKFQLLKEAVMEVADDQEGQIELVKQLGLI